MPFAIAVGGGFRYKTEADPRILYGRLWLAYEGCAMVRFVARWTCLSCLLLASCCVLPAESPPPPELATLVLEASVTEVDPMTGLPVTLVGTISGDYTGTYSEQILEPFFDAVGNLVGASSLSSFTFDSPQIGSLSSYNFAEVVAPILLTDPNGDPVLDPNGIPITIGLKTAATGDLFNGAEAVETAFGQLQTESDLFLTGGDMGLGRVTSTVLMLFTRDPNLTP